MRGLVFHHYNEYPTYKAGIYLCGRSESCSWGSNFRTKAIVSELKRRRRRHWQALKTRRFNSSDDGKTAPFFDILRHHTTVGCHLRVTGFAGPLHHPLDTARQCNSICICCNSCDYLGSKGWVVQLGCEILVTRATVLGYTHTRKDSTSAHTL